MVWALAYALGAALVAVSVYAAGELARRRRGRGPARPALNGAVAGLAWPLFVAGVTQFAAIWAVSRILRWLFGARTSCVPAGGISRQVVDDAAGREGAPSAESA